MSDARSPSVAGPAADELRSTADLGSSYEPDASALAVCARDKEWTLLHELLESGIDASGVDDLGRTALHYASGYGEIHAVGALLKARADANARDRAGMTPLHWACLKAHAPVVEILLKDNRADAFATATAGIFKGKCALDLADHAPTGAVREVLLRCLGASMFELRKVVGRGGYGCVVKAVRRDTGDTVALKAVRKSSVGPSSPAGKGGATLSAAKTERAVLSEIDHPFIIQLRAAFQTKQHLYLVMDFCSGGDLGLHIRNAPAGRLPEASARFVGGEVLLAVEREPPATPRTRAPLHPLHAHLDLLPPPPSSLLPPLMRACPRLPAQNRLQTCTSTASSTATSSRRTSSSTSPATSALPT